MKKKKTKLKALHGSAVSLITSYVICGDVYVLRIELFKPKKKNRSAIGCLVRPARTSVQIRRDAERQRPPSSATRCFVILSKLRALGWCALIVSRNSPGVDYPRAGPSTEQRVARSHKYSLNILRPACRVRPSAKWISKLAATEHHSS